jgi:hypothetical protein
MARVVTNVAGQTDALLEEPAKVTESQNATLRICAVSGLGAQVRNGAAYFKPIPLAI